MKFIDTHAHIYLPEFSGDLDTVISASVNSGVQKIMMPNIDSSTIDAMNQVARTYNDYCLPLIGLHPCSVNEDFEKELEIIGTHLATGRFFGIGETGTDLYWDKTHFQNQVTALEYQVKLARQYRLPLVLHSRHSMDETIAIIRKHAGMDLAGIFHCFSGSLPQALEITEMGFLLGVGGSVTYKNSKLPEVLDKIDIRYIVLETDSPYLSPIPLRGKRNEPSNLVYIAEKLAEIKKISPEDVAINTSQNAERLFRIRI
jgi:TatD DNase family protein